jgi:4'-phosphopantetheinyl transferase
MPLCYKIDNNDYILGLWELTEPESQLYNEFIAVAPQSEIEKAAQFKYPSRKAEWMASRLLLYLLINEVLEIDYDANGKPHISSREHSISISHTKGMIAVIIAKNLAGIDIELINERVLHIKDRFLSDFEKKQIPENDKVVSLLLYWSAKETLYKLYGQKQIDFKKNLNIRPFTIGLNGEMIGEIITENQINSYKLHFFHYLKADKNFNYIIVYHFS